MIASDQRVLADASRMEHEVLDHVKQALRVTLEWKAPAVGMPRKMSSLRFVAKSFCRHLQRMIDLEEQDGYMAVVAEWKPNLDARIRRLQRDHGSIRKQISDIEPEIDAITEYQLEHFNKVCRQIVSLLEEVDRHDEEEIDLLQESLLTDEGGEG